MRVGVILLCTLAMLSVYGVARASEAPSEEKEEILEIVDSFFLAMGSNDADGMARLVSPEAVLVLTGDGTGSPPIRREPLAELIEDYRTATGEVHEAYWSPTVLQRGDIAVVWAPYQLDINGARRHCGIDVFNLSRENGEWLIDALSFTMEPEACPELEIDGAPVRPVFKQ
ncbi:MAG: nuclear transport factor 2 family protein [Pseudomonadota bacterium]